MTAPTTQAEQEDAVRERYTVVYEGDSTGVKILSGEAATGRAVTVMAGDLWEEARTLRAERDAAVTRAAEEEVGAAMDRAFREIADLRVAEVEAQRDQLAADLRKAREEDRRPIATATKSSDQILLYGNLKGSPERAWYIGRWFRCGSYGGGWWVSSSVEVEATHWAPLPSPPALTPDPKDAGGTAKGDDHAGA